MINFSFEISKKETKTNARRGVIHTAHGDIQTPAFVAVGTQASVKSLANHELKEIGTQLFFVNTYHMYLRPGEEVLKKFGGLHNFISWQGPIITDSAGFQVFSLARGGRAEGRGRKLPALPRGREVGKEGPGGTEVPLVKINDDGVLFKSHLDGSQHFFTPEKSIELQNLMGADMMIAFDECAAYPVMHDYAKSAMERTHRWAIRSLSESSKFKVQSLKLGKPFGALYGVVQGGVYEDLRKESAKFIAGQPFEGIAIGGVAVGESKKEMTDVLDWTIPFLPEEKPRHLLGVGEIDDIFEIVERGIDTFDCVMPTRLGRMGFVLSKCKVQSAKCKIGKERFLLDLNKAENTLSKKTIDEDCQCFVCKSYSRGYLHHLFRDRELLGYRLATYHNLWFIERLMDDIRFSIENNGFSALKTKWLKENEK